MVGASIFSEIQLVGWLAVSLSVVVAAMTLLAWGRLPAMAFWLLLWIAVLAVLAVISGSLPPVEDLGDFLKGEGRTFLAFLPLLPFLSARLTAAGARSVLRRGLTTGVILLLGAVVASLLPLTRHFVVGSDGLLKAFSSSHHIPGYVGGLCLVVALSAPALGRRPRMIAAAAGVGAVALSSSRTSLIGLLVVFVYLAGRQLTPRRLVRIVGVAAILVVAVLGIDARARSTVGGFLGGDRLDDAAIAFQQGSDRVVTPSQAAADVNVLKRFGVWGEASRAWWRSPMVGSGPFRLNDLQVERSQLFPAVSIVTEGERVYSDFGAHNLVLQLAADGGVALLFPFLGLWAAVWKRGGRAELATGGPTARALIVFGWGISLTSNALLSPAFVFPLSALLGPLLAIDVDGRGGASGAAQHALHRA